NGPAGTGASVKKSVSSNFLREKGGGCGRLVGALREYNRWGPNEKLENFVMHLDGAARKWFLCLGAVADWQDTPAVVAAPGVAAVPAVPGLRTRFLAEFQAQHYSRYQEARLRQRKQGIEESGIEYFYDVIDL
ncbi:Uncharacterized protein APZ42_005269, partial [Daphnia magna]